MRYILIFFILISKILFSTSDINENTIRVYLSARISKDAHEWNNTVASALDDRFLVFKPQEVDISNVNKNELDKYIYLADLQAMIDSDIGILLPPYGRDCSWETGWYKGAAKPIFVYIENETNWLNDWMVKGGISAVITSNINTYEILMNDPIVKDKSVYIPSINDLSSAIIKELNRFFLNKEISKQLE